MIGFKKNRKTAIGRYFNANELITENFWKQSECLLSDVVVLILLKNIFLFVGNLV